MSANCSVQSQVPGPHSEEDRVPLLTSIHSGILTFKTKYPHLKFWPQFQMLHRGSTGRDMLLGPLPGRGSFH